MTAAPRERGILFSAPMVRAILEGRKTQTRRALRKQPPADYARLHVGDTYPIVIDRYGDEQPGAQRYGAYTDDGEWCMPCPYGRPGDRLWVKETFMDLGACCLYRADDNAEQERALVAPGQPWRLSIFMPRWASRITLEITDVRVERLKEISRGDAMAEGCPFANMADGPNPRDWYADQWKSINGPGSWDANPWVWVIAFRRIDAAAAMEQSK